MPKHARSTARDVFFYLLMIVTLYISVVSLITLLFQFVNLWIPDPLDYYSSGLSSLRAATAALFVAWPIFIYVSWVTEKDIILAPEKLRLGVRRWLLYLTLFISAITIIVDLIVLINEFLGGDFTLRFFLKTVSVLVVAIAVFGYYLRALNHESKNNKHLKVAVILSSVAVYLAIIVAFISVGSPAQQRGLRYDDQRVSDLSSIQWQLTEYYRQKQILPTMLSEMTTGLSQYTPPTDPENGSVYVYKKTGELTFDLCANFAFERQDNAKSRVVFESTQNDWFHSAGDYCFARTIDPDFYINEKPRPVDFSDPIVY